MSASTSGVSAAPVRLLLADVDGTLVTADKVLTERSVDAVRKLREADVLFAITSGRPPRGMQMLIEPLALTTPIAAFNGGVIVEADMAIVEQRTIAAPLVPRILARLDESGLDAWVYEGAEWFVRDPAAPHVAREAFTVRFEPTVIDSYHDIGGSVAKVVGISDDLQLVASVASAMQTEFGNEVSAARSQPYYLDVTHPLANKGEVAKFLSRRLGVPAAQMATIGDMPNDVLMFTQSGLSIAMGQSDREVQKAARRVTSSNEDEGFAEAVERFVLQAGEQSGGKSAKGS